MSSKKDLINRVELVQEWNNSQAKTIRELQNTVSDLNLDATDARIAREEARTDHEEEIETIIALASIIPAEVAVAVRTVVRMLDQRTEALAVKKGISIQDLATYEEEVSFAHVLTAWLGETDEDIEKDSETLWTKVSA